MDDRLRSENQSTLATVAAIFAFPYIWIGLFLLLSLAYGGNFFGQDIGGSLIALLLCLGLLNPVLPGGVANFVARPILLNLLAREIVSTAGCLVGLVGFVLTASGILYFLARDFSMALIFFLATPVVGVVLAIVVTLVGRGGMSISSGRRPGPPAPTWRVGRPEPRALPEERSQPALLGSFTSVSRLPSPRRSEDAGKSPGRTLPPRRRE